MQILIPNKYYIVLFIVITKKNKLDLSIKVFKIVLTCRCDKYIVSVNDNVCTLIDFNKKYQQLYQRFFVSRSPRFIRRN